MRLLKDYTGNLIVLVLNANTLLVNAIIGNPWWCLIGAIACAIFYYPVRKNYKELKAVTDTAVELTEGLATGHTIILRREDKP